MIPEVSLHAQQRALERIGRAPTLGQWRELVWEIVDGRALLLNRDARRGRDTYLMLLCGVPIHIVWQGSPGIVITVKPPMRKNSLKDIPIRRSDQSRNKGHTRRPETTWQDADA